MHRAGAYTLSALSLRHPWQPHLPFLASLQACTCGWRCGQCTAGHAAGSLCVRCVLVHAHGHHPAVRNIPRPPPTLPLPCPCPAAPLHPSSILVLRLPLPLPLTLPPAPDLAYPFPFPFACLCLFPFALPLLPASCPSRCLPLALPLCLPLCLPLPSAPSPDSCSCPLPTAAPALSPHLANRCPCPFAHRCPCLLFLCLPLPLTFPPPTAPASPLLCAAAGSVCRVCCRMATSWSHGPTTTTWTLHGAGCTMSKLCVEGKG